MVGSSFAGIHLAKRLAETLTSGFKVVLVERNSHFNYTFNFPRYAVVRGREGRAFIPYDGVGKWKPDGVFGLVRGTVMQIQEVYVVLDDGCKIEYEFLALATGVTQSPPATLLATEKTEACGS